MTDNKIDKLINYTFPGWALNRQIARESSKSLASFNSFDASSKTKAAFENFFTSITDADGSMRYEREDIIKRARDFARNKGIAAAAVNRVCDLSIGDKGLVCQPKIDEELLGLSKTEKINKQKELKQVYEDFAHNPLNDFYRDISPQEQGYNVLKSELEGGDCFTLLPKLVRAGSNFDLKTQLIEGELVSNPNGKMDSSTLSFGIAKNNRGIATKIHVANQHPGNTIDFKTAKWTEVELYNNFGRPNVLRHWNKLRPGQSRGLPLLTTAMEKIVQLEKLSNAELLASVLDAMYVIVFKGQKGKTAPGHKNSDLNSTDKKQRFKLGSGTQIELPKGVEADSWEPTRPNKLYDPFYKAITGEIAAAIGYARSILIMMFDKSFSASRGEVALSWIYFLSQRTKTAVGYYQKLYEAAIDESVAKGKITLRGYTLDDRIRRAWLGSPYNQWIGPKLPSIDELKEAKAEEIRINKSRVQSRQKAASERDGSDWIVDILPDLTDEQINLTESKLLEVETDETT